MRQRSLKMAFLPSVVHLKTFPTNFSLLNDLSLWWSAIPCTLLYWGSLMPFLSRITSISFYSDVLLQFGNIPETIDAHRVLKWFREEVDICGKIRRYLIGQWTPPLRQSYKYLNFHPSKVMIVKDLCNCDMLNSKPFSRDVLEYCVLTTVSTCFHVFSRNGDVRK